MCIYIRGQKIQLLPIELRRKLLNSVYRFYHYITRTLQSNVVVIKVLCTVFYQLMSLCSYIIFIAFE